MAESATNDKFVNQSAEATLKQIRDKNYAGAYLADPREKVLLGINFSSQEKTVDDWRHESITCQSSAQSAFINLKPLA